MKNPLARLLALVGLVALVVGFAGTGTARAQTTGGGGGEPPGTIGGVVEFFDHSAHQITALTLDQIEQKVEEGLAILIPDRPKSELATGIEAKKREMRQLRIAGQGALRDLERTVDGLLQDVLRQHPGRDTARLVRLAREQVRESARTNKELIDNVERRDRSYLEDQKGWMFDVGDIKDPSDAEKELDKKLEEEQDRDKEKNDADNDGVGDNATALQGTRVEAHDVIVTPPSTGAWTALQLQKIVTTAGMVMSGIVSGCPCKFTLDVVEGTGPDSAQNYTAGGAAVAWIYAVPVDRQQVTIHISIDCTPPPPAPAPGLDVDVHADDPQFQPASTTGAAIGPTRVGPKVGDKFDGDYVITFGDAAPGTVIHQRITFTHGGDTCTKDILILIVP